MDRGWCILATAILALPGCADDGDPGATPAVLPTTGTGGASDPASAALDPGQPAPLHVGDWWRYDMKSTMAGVTPAELTLVVAEERGDAWTLAAVEQDASNVTFFTHVPALGPVRKSDLALTRHDRFVPMLRFPLADGATWTSDVRGPWQAEAQAANLTVAGQTVPGWRVEYRQGGALQHVVEWSPVTKWFVSEATYFGEAEPRHQIELKAWGSNHTGPVRVRISHDLYVKGHFFNATAPANAAGAEGFTVPSSGQGLLLGFFMGGNGGLCQHYFVSPPGTPDSRGGGGVCGPPTLEWAAQPPVPGQWHAAWAVAGEGSFTFSEALLLEARTVAL